MATEFSIRDAISPDLRRAMDKLKDKRPLLKLAAEAVIGIGEQSFNNPSMRVAAWPALTAATIKRKGHDKPLKDQGILMRSLMANEPQSDQVEIGSDRPQANAQNFGYKGIPARPFIPIAANGTALPAAEKAIKEVVEGHLRKTLPT
jgi:phage gpG-like protein